jgi:hypothetical protein
LKRPQLYSLVHLQIYLVSSLETSNGGNKQYALDRLIGAWCPSINYPLNIPAGTTVPSHGTSSSHFPLKNVGCSLPLHSSRLTHHRCAAPPQFRRRSLVSFKDRAQSEYDDKLIFPSHPRRRLRVSLSRQLATGSETLAMTVIDLDRSSDQHSSTIERRLLGVQRESVEEEIFSLVRLISHFVKLVLTGIADSWCKKRLLSQARPRLSRRSASALWQRRRRR